MNQSLQSNYHQNSFPSYEEGEGVDNHLLLFWGGLILLRKLLYFPELSQVRCIPWIYAPLHLGT